VGDVAHPSVVIEKPTSDLSRLRETPEGSERPKMIRSTRFDSRRARRNEVSSFVVEAFVWFGERWLSRFSWFSAPTDATGRRDSSTKHLTGLASHALTRVHSARRHPSKSRGGNLVSVQVRPPAFA